MKGNTLIILVIAALGFMFLSGNLGVKTTSKTVGLTPSTSGLIGSIASALGNIFSGSSSPLTSDSSMAQYY